MNNSELILNDDGSLYHIGIRPEHCAPLIITVGDPDRVPIVSQFFDRTDFTNRKREIYFYGLNFANTLAMKRSIFSLLEILSNYIAEKNYTFKI